jgi:tetrahydrodipicolinate N-succinyltransferase
MRLLAQMCVFGRHCVIGANVSLEWALIGNHVIIHSGSRLGQDGFGYARMNKGYVKIPTAWPCHYFKIMLRFAPIRRLIVAQRATPLSVKAQRSIIWFK